MNFENLIVKLHIFCINIHVKFHSNRMLFTIRSINLFLYILLDYKILKFKYLIDDITIYFLFS